MSNTTNTKTPAVQAAEFWVQSKPDFTLFKRNSAGRVPETDERWAALPFSFIFKYEGKRYPVTLKTNNAKEAKKQARDEAVKIVAGIIGGEAEKPKAPVPTGTLQDLHPAYESSPVDAAAKARKQNFKALCQFMRVANGIPEGPRGHKASNGRELKLALDQINGDVTLAWFQAKKKEAEEAPNQRKALSIRRTANSRFKHAKSVFAPKAMAIYKKLGLYHPGFDEFITAGESYCFSRLPSSQAYQPAPEAVRKATLAHWKQMATAKTFTQSERNLFLAMGHVFAFGLRKGEITQATWGWWTTQEGYHHLENGNQEVNVKNNSACISVRAVDPYFSIMRDCVKRHGWNLGPDGKLDKNAFILVGTETDRLSETFRDVSSLMREELDWNTTKAIHELRKLMGSLIAMRYKERAAQAWLRHGTLNTTEGSYMGYRKTYAPDDVTTMEVRWAAVGPVALPAPAPSIRILEQPSESSTANANAS